MQRTNQKGTVKITIVGTGMVGATTAYTLLMRGIGSELVLIDKDTAKAEGEAMDLRHGTSLAFPMNITVGDYEDAVGSDIVILTAGATQKEGENRLDLVHKNVAIFKEIVPSIARACPEAILIVVANPVDILTYVTLKISGFRAHRVIGSGTVLDSSRFRQILSEHCRVDARNVHAYIIGEHGDSEVPLWSLANIGGISIDDYCGLHGKSCTLPDKSKILEEVRKAAYEIIERKGATYYAIGLALTRIVEAILRDENSVLTVSSLINGHYEVNDLCLSLPTIINRNGVGHVLHLPLGIEERQAFRESAEIVKEILNQIQ